MMKFMDCLENNEKTKTENGAVGYKTSGSGLVDLNFKIPSMRTSIDYDLFDKCYKEDREHTLKWLLYLRDISKGAGERNSFRKLFLHLADTDIKFGYRFATLPIEDFGRWDDYIYVAYYTKNEVVSEYILEKIFNQLKEDIENKKAGKPISLLAKWMCSENASNKTTKKMAHFLKDALGMSSRDYRKMLSSLRKYLDVVEVKMSKNDWSNIDYERVPSKANLIYRDAFYVHDRDRRMKYLSDLSKGEAKINANSMFLFDMIHKYCGCDYYDTICNIDSTIELLWDSQDKVDGFTDTLVVRDGSGSMCQGVSGNITALDICDSITLYASENNKGMYKDKFLTFSAMPKVVDLSNCTSLGAKLNKLHRYDDYTTTNIESVFDIVLDTAIKNHCSQEDLPKQILIISDMEFNSVAEPAYRENQYSLFENISNKFEVEGYTMPKLIFWNVASRTNAIPLQQNDAGVILIGGFSKNLFDMVLSTELDPYKALIDVLDNGRYDCVKEIVAE